VLIFILTDSLSLPRVEPQKVALQDTYIMLLKNAFPQHEIVSLSIGGATLEMLESQFFTYYFPVNPDMVIVHAGIVDCAPRALKTWEVKLFNSAEPFQFFYKHLIKKHTIWLRKKRNLTYTHLGKFGEIAYRYKNKLGQKIFWIGIAPASDDYELQLPGIKKNIQNYNNLLKSIFEDKFISVDAMPADCLMSDYHHLNERGHRFIFENLKNKIKSGE